MKSPHSAVDNVLPIRSRQPETMDAHIVLYCGALYSADNTWSFRLMEAVSSYDRMLNNCAYRQK